MKQDIRCGACSRKLGHGQFEHLEIKCPRCGTLNTLMRAQSPEPERPERLDDGTEHGSEDQPDGPRPQRL